MKAIFALILLMTSFSAQAGKLVLEETLLKCEALKTADGNTLDGAPAISIVRFPYDSTYGSTYHVKTRVAAPGVLPKFAELKLVVASLQGSDWETEKYYLEVKPNGGSMIYLKPAKTTKAPCTVVAE